MKRALLALAALAAAAVATPAVAKDGGLTIVISIDGFRADYFDRNLSPTLAALAQDGVRAKAMRPSFPSVTQPNHYTLMTGLTPNHHGIVDNGFLDPAIPGLHFGEGTSDNLDPRFWTTATPLWVSAHKAGMKIAESHWPNGRAKVAGVDFDYHNTADSKGDPNGETTAVLGWLDLPAAERPKLMLVHYSPVDTMGHVYGPDAPQVNAAIGQVDKAIGALIDGLKARKLTDTTNIVVVSDHGMTFLGDTPPGYILDTLLDLNNVTVSVEGADAGLWPKPGHEAEIEKIMVDTVRPHMTCWRKKDIPAHLHYAGNSRIPPILCLGDLGWSVVTNATLKKYPVVLKGNHGYDPAEPQMAAFFLAHGPAFKRGVTLEPFDNVDVYPMLTKVVGVTAEPNDGNAATLAPALR